jgi:hypothetical protein
VPLGEQRFQARLVEAAHYENIVAEWLRAHGLEVLVDVRAGGTQVDLVVGRLDPCHVEVKATSRPFTAPHNFPFVWPRIDTTAAYDKKGPEPRAYVLISQVTLATAVVLVQATRHTWRREMRWDGDYGAEREVWELPRSELRPFSVLVACLRARENPPLAQAA